MTPQIPEENRKRLLVSSSYQGHSFRLTGRASLKTGSRRKNVESSNLFLDWLDWNLEIRCTKVLISWLNLTTEIFRSKSWQGSHFRSEVTRSLCGSQSVPLCPETGNFSSDHEQNWISMNFNDCRCNLIQRAWVRDNVRGGIDVKVLSHMLITG